MIPTTFRKFLTANDTGESGGHQAGIHIPKKEVEFLDFLPKLDSSIKNPDFWLHCIDEDDIEWSFRYIHYNNKLHDEKGTRNEYRITHMTKYFKARGARAGDIFSISNSTPGESYRIGVENQAGFSGVNEPVRIKLKGWSKVY